ncbi:Zn(2)-C6 fungal-type domain-containing protein [Mycena venus]|uniref:Zn(2)-C6 fungal-type domain-containing protein n=1 Tax=Mycena venus TaxID=2733690 RepID=A0A8H6XKW9_9AGAR|nr:Zn(2)-C6 fungal-type domain-containing protein [Mycena venus]
MPTQEQSQKRPKKPPACDSCKARRVLCHPQPNGAPCPRCVEKNTICTTTPVVRGRPRRPIIHATTPPTTFVETGRGSSLAVSSLSPDSAALVVDHAPNCPTLNPEFVAHCFECFEFIPQVSHPLIRRTKIREEVEVAAHELHTLPPQSRVLALCIIAVASLASFHESILGPGPRPKSLVDREFFSSNQDFRAFGLRRATAYRALRSKAIKSAWEIGAMLEPTEENAMTCYLLDLLEQSDSCGASRPYAGAYILHVRALAPRWRAAKYTESDEARWAGFLMSESLFATARRMPMLITQHDQLLLSGPEPAPLDSFLASLESSKKPGLQVVWPSMKPYALHVVSLARQLSETINGEYARLNPLSEAAVIKFLSSLTHLHSIASLLLTRVDASVGATPDDRMPMRYEDGTADTMARACGYGVVIGFISLVLPFYRELELRGDEGEPRTRERMRLFRMQARDIAVLGLHELARALRYLPSLHYTPLNWRIIYPWAEFCAERAPDGVADLETIVNELKIMGYSLDVLSAPQATQLIGRLDAYLGKSTEPSPEPVQDFLNSAELAELFLPLEQPWIGVSGDDGMMLDAPQDAFRFSQFAGE